MAKLDDLHVSIKCAWWVNPYIGTLCFLADLFQMEPDIDKAWPILKKGITLEMVKAEKDER